MHACVAVVTLAVVVAPSALAHRVMRLTPQCVLVTAIVQTLTSER